MDNLTDVGLLEIQCICDVIPEECLLAEPNRTSQLHDGVSALKMGIENDLCHRKDATGHERIENLSQCSFPVRYLAQDGDQQGAIGGTDFQFTLSHTGLKKSDVVQIRRLGPLLGTAEHARLEVNRYHFTLRADSSGKRDGEPPRSATDTDHFHTGSQV